MLGLGPVEQCLGPTSAALGNSAILRKLAPASPLALVGLWLHIFYNESAWWARLWAWRDPTVCHPLDPCPHILRAGGVCQGRSVGSAPVAFSVSLRVRPRAASWEVEWEESASLHPTPSGRCARHACCHLSSPSPTSGAKMSKIPQLHNGGRAPRAWGSGASDCRTVRAPGRYGSSCQLWPRA